MLDKYLQCYFPTTGEAYYEIMFEDYLYIIDTGSGMDEEVSEASTPYKGFISFRPSSNDLPTYLVTPEGIVWFTVSDDIEEIISREESIVEKTEWGTSTSTMYIDSRLEPVVNHFRENPDTWKKYGTLTSKKGKYKLVKE